jgi:hypothetical protein
MTLPKEIDDAVDKRLKDLPFKEWNIEKLFYSASIQNRLRNIYRQDKAIKEKK